MSFLLKVFMCLSHDLDNILLENLGDTRTLQAVFELEALVLTGEFMVHSHDPISGLL